MAKNLSMASICFFFFFCLVFWCSIVNMENNQNTALSDHMDWNWYSGETCIPPCRALFLMCYLMRLWCVIWCTSNVYFPIPWWGHLPIPQGAPGRQERGEGAYCFTISKNLEIANFIQIIFWHLKNNTLNVVTVSQSQKCKQFVLI